jgi:hypothetical protein
MAIASRGIPDREFFLAEKAVDIQQITPCGAWRHRR